MREVLVDGAGARLVVVGADFHFGRGRGGDVALLQRMGAELGFEVIGAGAGGRRAGGTIYSSTHIRDPARRGRRRRGGGAARPPARGSGRGWKRVIGAAASSGSPPPTWPCPRSCCLPADGIYAGTFVGADGIERVTAISLGRRPTFYEQADASLLEAHLLDFDGDLYGQDVKVRFVQRLRGEVKFDSVDALVEQIARDVDAHAARARIACARSRVSDDPEDREASEAPQDRTKRNPSRWRGATSCAPPGVTAGSIAIGGRAAMQSLTSGRRRPAKGPRVAARDPAVGLPDRHRRGVDDGEPVVRPLPRLVGRRRRVPRPRPGALGFEVRRRRQERLQLRRRGGREATAPTTWCAGAPNRIRSGAAVTRSPATVGSRAHRVGRRVPRRGHRQRPVRHRLLPRATTCPSTATSPIASPCSTVRSRRCARARSRTASTSTARSRVGRRKIPGPLKAGIYRTPTIFERLIVAGVPLCTYHTDIPVLLLWGEEYRPWIKPLDVYFEQCTAGTLPNVVAIAPGFTGNLRTDDHSQGDVRLGQRFIREAFNAFAASPQWERGLFIVTYDEWGGFFDHVKPPLLADQRASPDLDESFALAGFRVPTILASPYARPGLRRPPDVRPHVDPPLRRVAVPGRAARGAGGRGGLEPDPPGPPRQQHRGLARRDAPRSRAGVQPRREDRALQRRVPTG